MQKIRPNLEDIRNLTREEKIDKLVSHMKSHYLSNIQFYPSLSINGTQIVDSELRNIFEKIEDKILWITHAPRFEFFKIENNKVVSSYYSVCTYDSSIEELNNLCIVENKYIAFYNIHSEHGTYITRFALIEDPEWKSKIRDEKINKVLNNEKPII